MTTKPRWGSIPADLKDRVVDQDTRLSEPANHVTHHVSGNVDIIVIDLNPFPSPRMVRSDKWAQRPVVSKYFQWRKDFVILCRQQGYTLENMLRITFIFKMPQSWSRKKQSEMNGVPHQSRPDLDNCLKSCMDAFGIEDGFVWNISAKKYWGYAGRIIIERK